MHAYTGPKKSSKINFIVSLKQHILTIQQNYEENFKIQLKIL